MADTNVTIDLQHELTKGFAGRYIRRKARQLMGHAGLRNTDIRDVEQHLALAVFRAVPRFDAGNGHWRSFVATVVERRADQFLKRRNAKKRGDRTAPVPLHTLVRNSEGEKEPLSNLVGEETREALTGRYTNSHVEQIEAAIDVQEILATLPPHLQRVGQLLTEMSQREVAEVLGISRRTLRDQIDEIRHRFLDAGFGIF